MGSKLVEIRGTKRWCDESGKNHRLDGPAVEYPDGEKRWYIHGDLHHLDGPAVECFYGDEGRVLWYVDNKKVNGPLDLLEHGANWRDLVEWLTPREIAELKSAEGN